MSVHTSKSSFIQMELELCNTPVAGSILMLVRPGRLTKEEGIKYLNSLKDMIKDEHLFYVKSRLEEL